VGRGVKRDRRQDRCARRLATEAVEAQVGIEEARDAALEAFEARERIFADRDQERDG
jgi:hypothetical protein